VARRATRKELEDWQRSGAIWRAVKISPRRAEIDLCSCSGELMERVESDDPELIEFVRARGPDSAAPSERRAG
jgi:hypothetical protein